MPMITPSIGAWFNGDASQQIFEVVAIDENALTIDIQYLDGSVCEYDFSTWRSLPLSAAAPPEDWRAPFELAQEDAWCDDQTWVPENNSGILTQIEPRSMMDNDDFEMPG